jgi:hypothetical protein
VDWLIDAIRRENNQFLGWGYGPHRPGATSDNSCTQYAVLALHDAAQVSGITISKDLWKEIDDYYWKFSQQDNGGWPYQPKGTDSRITMTAAGIGSMFMAGIHLAARETKFDGEIHLKCGDVSEREKHLQKALNYLSDQFTVNYQFEDQGGRALWRYYNLYAIERAGRLSGQRFVSGGLRGNVYDWYKAGAEFLTSSQQAEGSWSAPNSYDGNPVIATSFSLLFLAKGRTPILIHKLVHGPDALRGVFSDWNNDRNDVRNLTEFCYREVFQRKVPLTWQAFNGIKLTANEEAVADLLQAPILYLNGHDALVLKDHEKELLKMYIDQGGFIFAEACCGADGRGKEFDRTFRDLVKELWGPERVLLPIDKDHPIGRAYAVVNPEEFKLEGMSFGCKMSLVYAPVDMSCFWEQNLHDGPNETRAIRAFRMGANIVAYATGLEPPKTKGPRLDDVAFERGLPPRNALQAAQINNGGKDWQPAPQAMRNLMNHMSKEWNMDVRLTTTPITLRPPEKNLVGDRAAQKDLYDYKFLYMHGRGEFTIQTDKERRRLRMHLEHGGFLLADACCGDKKFDESFRKLIKDTFGRDLEPIKLDDPFFTAMVGKSIEKVNRRIKGGEPYTLMDPELEGIRRDKDDPRSPWIVIYSKWDLGCALDKHNTPDCLGHDHESAKLIAAQAVLYAVKE